MISTWFKSNWKSFLIALGISVGLIAVVALLPKWLFITILAVLFVGATAYKIKKNQPF
jgi:hypothetical protein